MPPINLKPYYDAAQAAEADVTRIATEMNTAFTGGDQKKALDLKASLDEAKKKAKDSTELYHSMRDSQAPADDTAKKFAQLDPSLLNLGMSDKEIKNYSLIRIINAATEAKDNPRAWEKAGLELEASRAMAEKLGRTPQGFFIPWDVQSSPYRTRNGGRAMQGPRNNQQAGDPTTGGYLIEEQITGESFIDVLRNAMVLQAAGARTLAGLVGDVDLPKKTAASNAYWIGEGNAPPKSTLTFGQLTGHPRTVAAYSQLSRRLLKQATPDVEVMVRDDIATTLALAVDKAGLHGAGSANEPLGVANMFGIGAVIGGTNGATPTWGNLVDLESEVALDNALMGSLSYITNSKIKGYLKKTRHNATYGDNYLWPVNANDLNSYPARVTNQVKSDLVKGSSSVCSAIFFGNWADLLLLFWGGLDVIVDPYTYSTSGEVLVTSMQDADIIGRRAQSFSAMLDALSA